MFSLPRPHRLFHTRCLTTNYAQVNCLPYRPLTSGGYWPVGGKSSLHCISQTNAEPWQIICFFHFRYFFFFALLLVKQRNKMLWPPRLPRHPFSDPVTYLQNILLQLLSVKAQREMRSPARAALSVRLQSGHCHGTSGASKSLHACQQLQPARITQVKITNGCHCEAKNLWL